MECTLIQSTSKCRAKEIMAFTLPDLTQDLKALLKYTLINRALSNALEASLVSCTY